MKLKLKMKTKIQMKITNSMTIDDGIFFPEDFTKLPKDTIIYIVKGKIINIKTKNENDNENTKRKKQK